MSLIPYIQDGQYKFLPSHYINKSQKTKKFKVKKKEKEAFRKLFEVISPEADLCKIPSRVNTRKIKVLNYTYLAFSVNKTGLICIENTPIDNLSKKNSYNIFYLIPKFPEIIFFETIAKDENLAEPRLFIVKRKNEYKCKAWWKLPKPSGKFLAQVPLLIEDVKDYITKNPSLLFLTNKIQAEHLFNINPILTLFKERKGIPEFTLLNYTPHDINIIDQRLCIKKSLLSKIWIFGECGIVAYSPKNQPELLHIHIKHVYNRFSMKYSFPLIKDSYEGYLCTKAYTKLLQKRAFQILFAATYDEGSPFFRCNQPLEIFRIIIQNYLN